MDTPRPGILAPPTKRLTAGDVVRILAVDDCDEDLFLLRRLLSKAEGFSSELATCSTLEECLVEMARNRFDILLVDYHLGLRTGAEVCAELRAQGYQGPIIMITGRGAEETALEALHAGVSDYLMKGVLSASSLARSVSNAVEKYWLHEELSAQRVELERTVERLSIRNREVESFYHTLSHELKTPLTATSEFIALTLEGIAGPITDDVRELLDVASRNCKNMTLVLNDILDASRLETGKLTVQPAPTCTWGTVERVRACYASKARSKGIRLEVLRSCADSHAVADEERIFQVLSNLVSNALKFTPSGGVIEIELGDAPDESDSLLLIVRDNGRGIDAEKQASIFERNFQTCEEDATVHGGLGLGLYICRELARLHGGEIEVDSEPDRGSRFTVTLPRNSHSAAPQLQEPTCKPS